MSVSPYDDGAEAVWTSDATGRMNKMYRWQRIIYDVTRRYYLLGRDEMIDGLQPASGAAVLEIGCGTGRNLIQAARHYPVARWFGIDISTEMLTTAISAIDKRRLGDTIRVAHGDATRFDTGALFAVAAFDRVMISYSLSMIPEWHLVLAQALRCLTPGGQLHIVDFGNQERLPRFVRALLLRWLALFDVTPRHDLQQELLALAAHANARLVLTLPFRGYAQLAVLTLPKA